MNEKYAVYIWASYGFTLAVLLWNIWSPWAARNHLRARLSEAADEGEET